MTMSKTATLRTQWVISTDGVRLHTVRLGQSNRPVIVLVHGYPDTHQVWRPVADRLAETYDVVLYDVRGAGQSDRPRRVANYTLPRLADDLAAVVDALLPHQSFHLVAHDWGSIQSWESVTGEQLRGRIASYTSLSGPSLDHAAVWLRDHLRHPTWAKKRAALQQIASSWYIAAFQLPLLAPLLWKTLLGRRWPAYLALREGVTEAQASSTQTADGCDGIQLYRANFLPRLLKPHARPAHCPVQLIVPTHDAYVGAQLFSDLHQWVAELYRRDIQASHWLPLSQPQVLAEWIDQFVHGIESGQMPASLRACRVMPDPAAAGVDIDVNHCLTQGA
jgi:pimeloyl-ACP methyl ester carboxylesterase